jgi:3-phosphoshikimate 1-carboxyvinyltransferase
MVNLKVEKTSESFDLNLENIASDKSISHRCAIFSLLSDKPSKIRNFLRAEDTMCTLNISKGLGADIEDDGETITITPKPTLNEPNDILDCGNSGTAIRLLSGFLSSSKGLFILTGDKYLRKRPMKRVANPLREIGASIDGRENGNLAPLVIRGNEELSSFNYESKIASAQVKSAMILAALKAKEKSFYKEPELSRDHTERMLNGMGASVKLNSDGIIEIEPLNSPLKPLDITVPADPSSAFFFAVATAITPNAKIILKNVTLNPTRVEAFEVLKRMGTKVVFQEKENVYEPIGDIIVEYAPMNGVEVSENISWLIDELPALSIAFCYANGKSVVKNAEELRVKESDRISSIVNNLKLCGAKVEEFEDGYEIESCQLQSATINSYGDHRVAMSFAIAGTKCGMEIEDIDCINTSFPNFVDILSKITKVTTWK